MRLLVINPNTTASMTEKIGLAARSAASPGTEVIAMNPASGPVSIEGYYDEALSVPGLLHLIQTTPGYDAVIIACFDDTGLDAARCLTDKPVIGIGEAAYHFASMIANKFSVVTTLARSVPALEHNLHKYGLSARCARVRSSEVAVLELEHPGSDACNRISAEIGRAAEEDRAEAIVLGCAGMADLAGRLAAEHGLPVLDGVTCAVKLAEAMVGLGLRTSRLGGYAPPPVQKLRAAG
ncbi:aspartate/glutamate racemase family protein [Tabrizicola sp.]|uniref:aspartate/glutamate racemase family protein n=1 Tax=Tabrizicola sp. TaxID=2005166 RepID=UPI0035AF0B77